MSREGVRNIDGYNAKHKLKMPYIVVVVDEMSDLMLVAGKGEEYIQTFKWQEHMEYIIMATQRPSVDVIAGTIEYNFPTSFFRLVQKLIVEQFGEQGAEQLLGEVICYLCLLQIE